MPPSQIAAYPRFYQPAVTAIYVASTMANYLAPTRAELDAALNVTRQVSGIDGFSVEGDQIETPDFASLYTSKIGGRTSSPDSSLTYYAAKSGADIRTIQPLGWAGFIVMLPGGDVSGYKADVFPVLVISPAKQYSDSDAFGIMVQYSITAQPALDVPIP